MANEPLDEKAVFRAACKIDSPEARGDYLKQACGDDSALLERVAALLKVHDEEQSFLESPPPGIAPTVDLPPITEKPGSQIGPYKLLQELGEGGMGVVYMAEQREPMERRVALKIIKPGMDTRQVIARFEAERQALAMMDHPNIDKVLDAGTTESGRPYFVMELVMGLPITQYCDQQHLTPKERLDLFIPVCQAVQHAHQKGIIHRDLKPSNVLIALYDDRPVPKIIDFGVAKATSQKLTEKTMFTHYGQIVGTLEYMSPEQANLNQLDIDTRSDIYSMGVLLYELLTGCTPFDKERLRSAAFDEMMRIIREEEPPKPSLRLSTSQSLPSIAANRKIEPKSLSTLVSGELDWIVMKALEKDRTRRYETANGFANDIQRYLNDEPVVACPPSAAYRFRKFVRRNKTVLATVSIVVLSLVVGLAGTTWQAIRATNARDDAIRAQTEEAEQRASAEEARVVAEDARRDERAQREEAERQRERAEANFALARSAVDEFLNQVTKNELLTVPGLQSLRQELLSSAIAFYEDFTQDAASASELLVELAAAHHRIGVIRGELGQTEQSSASNAKSIELFEQLLDAGNNSLDVPLGLAKAYYFSGRYNDTVALCQSILKTDSKHAEARNLLAEVYNGLALDEKNDNDVAAALKYHHRALPLREGLVRDFPDNPEYLAGLGATLNNLGNLLSRQGKNREALAMYERGVSYNAEAYRKAPQTILWGQWLGICLGNLASKQAKLGNQDGALQSYQQLVHVRRKLVFENAAVPFLKGHLYEAYLDLGNYQLQLGHSADAKRAFRGAQEVLENIPHDTPDGLFELATVYAVLATPDDCAEGPTQAERDDQQRYADSAVEAIVKAVLKGFRNVTALQSNKHFAALRKREDLQQLIDSLDKELQAEQLATKEADADEQKLTIDLQVVDVLRELIDSEAPTMRHRASLATTLYSIGEIQVGLKQYVEAEKSLLEALELRKQVLDEKGNDPQAAIDVLAVQISLGSLDWAAKDYPKAHRRWKACLGDLLQLAQAHRHDPLLQARLASEERKIFSHYGRCGLWPLVREFATRNVEFRRVVGVGRDEVVTDGEFSAVIIGHNDREFVRNYFQQLAASFPKTEYRRDPCLIHLVRGIAASGNCDLFSEELLASTRAQFDEQSDNPWQAGAMAMVHYCYGRYTEAESVLERFQGDWPQIAFLDAAIASKLGNRERAHRRWSAAKSRYRQICRDALAREVADYNHARVHGDTGIFTENWWEFAYGQVMRRLASEAMSGEPSPDDPWQRLIQARGYRMIGEIDKAEEELAAASAAAPDGAEVWLARARLFEKWGENERAEADWQKVVDLAGDDPMPWIHRGRWYAERGEHEKADADFAKAASLTPNELNKFLEAGWWVVGPYPPNLDEFCPPEIDPGPAKPVYVIDPATGLSNQPVRWNSLTTRESQPGAQDSYVDLTRLPGHKSGSSSYAFTYVFAPEDRSVTLLTDSNPCRVWVNGTLAGKATADGTPWFKQWKRVPICLRPGRNTILIKTGSNGFMALLSDAPVARAWELLKFGDFPRAREIYAEVLQRPAAEWIVRAACSASLLRGDMQRFREFAKHLPGPSNLTPVAESDLPLLKEKLERWYANPDLLEEKTRRWDAAWSHYRLGELEKVVEILENFKDFPNSRPVLLAMTYHRLNQPERAQLCLSQMDALVDTWLKDFDGSGRQYLWCVYPLYREACELIRGDTVDLDTRFAEFFNERRRLWEARDPVTCAFDDAIRNSPQDCHAWLARGKRLAELGRFDEAEADFSKAVALTPDEYQPLLKRGEFYASQERLSEAADDLTGALDLANRCGWWPHGRRVEIAIRRYAQVLDEVQNRRPESPYLWRLRGERAAAMYDWQEAARCFTTSDNYWGHAVSLAAICRVQDDSAGHETAFLRLSELLDEQVDQRTRFYWRAIVLGLQAQDAERAEELTRLAETVGVDAPTSRGYHFAVGLAHFRAQRYEEAIDWLQKSPWVPGASHHQIGPSKWAVLAMASFHVGRTEEARRWLKRCEMWSDLSHRRAMLALLGDNDAGRYLGGPTWIIAYALTREAKVLIDGPEALAAEQERCAARQAELQSVEKTFQRMVDREQNNKTTSHKSEAENQGPAAAESGESKSPPADPQHPGP